MTAIWYILSVFGFLATLFSTDFYLLADDVFMFATGMSLFYSWQTYEDDVYWARQVLVEILVLPATLKRLAAEKKRLRSEGKTVSPPKAKNKK